MPGTRCAVALCNNSREVTKKANLEIKYHSFPKQEKIREIWIQRCKRDGKWNASTSYICSVHFKADDYQRDLKAELLNLPPKKILNLDGTCLSQLYFGQFYNCNYKTLFQTNVLRRFWFIFK